MLDLPSLSGWVQQARWTWPGPCRPMFFRVFTKFFSKKLMMPFDRATPWMNKPIMVRSSIWGNVRHGWTNQSWFVHPFEGTFATFATPGIVTPAVDPRILQGIVTPAVDPRIARYSYTRRWPAHIARYSYTRRWPAHYHSYLHPPLTHAIRWFTHNYEM